MATSFEEFLQEVEEEAQGEGPVAVAELESLHTHFAWPVRSLSSVRPTASPRSSWPPDRAS